MYKRLLLQAQQVEWLEVFVRAPRRSSVPLGTHGMVRGFSGNKLSVFFHMLLARQRGRVDVVTAQDPFYLGLVAWVRARTHRSALQLQIHTDLFAPEFVSRNTMKVALAKFLLRHADAVRVVSQRIQASLVPLGLRAKVSVLPIFVDAAAVASAVSGDIRSRYARFSHIVLVASRLEPEKNVADSLVVMQKVLASVPTAGLLVAGEGSQRQALEGQARDLGIADRVVFLGFRDDVFSLYKSADVLLVTSWYEGYGASIVEALAAGCAVVSPDIGVAAEAGATVVPREQLAQATAEVLQNRTRGVLHMQLLPPEEYARAWKETLVV